MLNWVVNDLRSVGFKIDFTPNGKYVNLREIRIILSLWAVKRRVFT